MKLRLNIITRGIVYLMALAVISVCGILLPELAREEAVANPNVSPAYPYLIAAWIFSLPIFVALYQTHKLLSYLDNNTAFSFQSIKALQTIKTCATIFSILIVLGAAAVIFIARDANPTEDVTPVITFGILFTFTSSVIATFTAVLQKLLQQAIDMKLENDLTV